MGKKRGWLGFLKRFFVCKAESIKEKGTKRKRWCFGMLKTSRNYHALETFDTKVNVRKEDQNQKQHTLALAVAMTAAAEAAVAAASAAAELARLVRSTEDLERRIRNEAAVKIQSFYRSHLAWKALIGLKGVVKLQAVIRGHILRRKFLNRLKNTQRSKVHQIRVPTFDQISMICKDKQDLFSPRKTRRNGHILEDPTRFDQKCEPQKKLRLGDRFHAEDQHNSPSFRSRMSYNAKRHYHLSPDRSDETSLPNSPIFPAYMAMTESFMAKARSLSTPRQRLSFLDEYCTHGSSFGMPMLSSSSSFNGGMKGNYRHTHL